MLLARRLLLEQVLRDGLPRSDATYVHRRPRLRRRSGEDNYRHARPLFSESPESIHRYAIDSVPARMRAVADCALADRVGVNTCAPCSVQGPELGPRA